MPDLTDQILAEITPDPRYSPLYPTVGKLEDYAHSIKSEHEAHIDEGWTDNEQWVGHEDYQEHPLENYADDLDYQGDHITYEWATNEMLGHQMNWVRVGLVAERVRRYRIYQPKFPTWNNYCKEVLGKKVYQMKKTIKASLAVMELIRHGFPIVPNCISQAQMLLDCCKKSGMLLIDAWELVLEQLPAAHLITSNNIAEALGFAVDYSEKIPKRYHKKIQELAKRDGVSITDKLDEWFEQDSIEPTEDDELDESEGELDEEEQLWHQEMQEMVREHDHQLWFLTAISKMVQPLRSRYSWLRQLRLQT